MLYWVFYLTEYHCVNKASAGWVCYRLDAHLLALGIGWQKLPGTKANPYQSWRICNGGGVAEACNAGQKLSGADVTGAVRLYCRVGSINGALSTVQRTTLLTLKNSFRL